MTNDKPSRIKYNEKILDALAIAASPDTRTLTFEGSIRSAKTATAVMIFDYLVQRQTAKFALLAAEDYNSLRTNLLEAEIGLLTMFPERYKLVSPPIGSKYVEARTRTGIKEILLAGYSNKSKWEKILGKDIETIFIDEGNIADEQFVNETYARQGATEHPVTIITLNGDDPQHKLYQERINKSLIIGRCPASIRADMDAQTKKKRGYYYMHWTFNDNPKLKKKQIVALSTLFPVGSHYYKTRVLGERGKWGSMIFADYMTQDLLVNTEEKTEDGKQKYPMQLATIGVDIAEARATNVFALIGFAPDFRAAYVKDLMVFYSQQNGKSVGYQYKTQMLQSFVQRHNTKPLECIPLDSAEGNYIKDLQTLSFTTEAGKNVPIIPSYKATIKERIDMLILLMSTKRIFFDVKCLAAFQAYQAAIWTPGKEGKEREDNNLPMNDIMDAVEYGLTRHMNALLKSTKRGI